MWEIHCLITLNAYRITGISVTLQWRKISGRSIQTMDICQPRERAKLSELSTASALESLYQMGSLFSPLFNPWERRQGKIRKRKGKGERREGGKSVLQPEERGQNFFSEWQIQISYFAMKGLKTLQEICSCYAGHSYRCFLKSCLYLLCTEICYIFSTILFIYQYTKNYSGTLRKKNTILPLLHYCVFSVNSSSYSES